jgi:hypothetical protein
MQCRYTWALQNYSDHCVKTCPSFFPPILPFPAFRKELQCDAWSAVCILTHTSLLSKKLPIHHGADFPAESKGSDCRQVQLFPMFPLIAHESDLVPFQMEEFFPELRRKCYCVTGDLCMILLSTAWTECIKYCKKNYVKTLFLYWIEWFLGKNVSLEGLRNLEPHQGCYGIRNYEKKQTTYMMCSISTHINLWDKVLSTNMSN